MNSRVALIMPSADAKQCELFISTLPTETSRVTYVQYWDAVERMIEFVAEVRVLAQLVEHSSARLLQECVGVLHAKRRGIITRRTTALLHEFDRIISQTANLSRLLAIAQTLNNPATWSRAEFATSKAAHLLQACSVPQSLQHAAENITNLNALVEHLDELFLTDSRWQRERVNFFSSLAITALSLVLTILILPSFWADLNHLDASLPGKILTGHLGLINKVGTGLAVALVAIATMLLVISLGFLTNNLRRTWKSRR
ncbi:hypothetical protein D6833_05410 [Candidatus Parcubacteria bacterium]|nr:MAG: hypothetical protein D6833_05410 [Candidatus Parcubacteria bacterium]